MCWSGALKWCVGIEFLEGCVNKELEGSAEVAVSKFQGNKDEPTDVFSEPLDVHLPEIGAINQHTAAVRVVEAFQQLNDRTFAASTFAHHRHRQALLQAHTQSLEDLRSL